MLGHSVKRDRMQDPPRSLPLACSAEDRSKGEREQERAREKEKERAREMNREREEERKRGRSGREGSEMSNYASFFMETGKPVPSARHLLLLGRRALTMGAGVSFVFLQAPVAPST